MFWTVSEKLVLKINKKHLKQGYIIKRLIYRLKIIQIVE